MVPYTTIGSFLGTLKGIHFLDPPRGLGICWDSAAAYEGVGRRLVKTLQNPGLQGFRASGLGFTVGLRDWDGFMAV